MELLHILRTSEYFEYVYDQVCAQERLAGVLLRPLPEEFAVVFDGVSVHLYSPLCEVCFYLVAGHVGCEGEA